MRSFSILFCLVASAISFDAVSSSSVAAPVASAPVAVDGTSGEGGGNVVVCGRMVFDAGVHVLAV